MGFADARIAKLTGATEAAVRETRKQKGVDAVFNSVDTCGAEFEAFTPYLYSTYEGADESKRTPRKKIMILGGGPNRIGQGIEFDYCCVHAAFALKEEDYETIMVNCNPETVSTDYDTSDKLYFEPLTMEEVMNIVDREKPDGVIVQFGGQTPLKLALGTGARRRADHRHIARQHRSGRGPRTLLGADQPPGDQAARQRHRALVRRSVQDRRGAWLSGVGTAFLCARRPCHANRV